MLVFTCFLPAQLYSPTTLTWFMILFFWPLAQTNSYCYLRFTGTNLYLGEADLLSGPVSPVPLLAHPVLLGARAYLMPGDCMAGLLPTHVAHHPRSVQVLAFSRGSFHSFLTQWHRLSSFFSAEGAWLSGRSPHPPTATPCELLAFCCPLHLIRDIWVFIWPLWEVRFSLSDVI